MIDINKQYRTRDGREVRIYATDGMRGSSVHGSVREKDRWMMMTWKEDGTWRDNGAEHEHDLIKVRPRHKRTVWLNVYEDRVYGADDRYVADATADTDRRIACIKVDLDFEEGEGL